MATLSSHYGQDWAPSDSLDMARFGPIEGAKGGRSRRVIVPIDSQKEMTSYSRLLAKKTSWTPQEMRTGQRAQKGSALTLAKCLTLRHLELQVGEWLTETTSRERALLNQDNDLAQLLDSNIKDEIRHDQALANLYQAFESQLPAETWALIEAEAAQLRKSWLEAASRLQPIGVIGVLESSVFFVALPLMRKLGSSGFRNVSQDISSDEAVHVATHLQLCRDLGHGYDRALDELREATVQWLTADLDCPEAGRYGLPQVWLESSRRLLKEGQAPDLSETKTPIYPAFFEMANDALPAYY